jgi:hypothetical protein
MDKAFNSHLREAFGSARDAKPGMEGKIEQLMRPLSLT